MYAKMSMSVFLANYSIYNNKIYIYKVSKNNYDKKY